MDHSNINSASRSNTSTHQSHSSFNGHTRDSTFSNVTDIPSQPLNNTDRSQVSDIQSSRSISTPSVTHEPRRSGRHRHAPNRYGDWVFNQHTAVDPDDVEIFV